MNEEYGEQVCHKEKVSLLKGIVVFTYRMLLEA